MDIDLALFTRQQIRERVGIPDDVLNYFSREGVLRAAEGGTGRGQHRRFPFVEVNIAAVLFQLKQVMGTNIATLREVAGSLRTSVDFIRSLEVTPAQLDAAIIFASWHPDPDSRPKLRPGEVLPDPRALKLVREHDPEDLREMLHTYWGLVDVPEAAGDMEQPVYLVKTVSERWALMASTDRARRDCFAFVAIELGRMLHSVWYGDRG